MGNGIDVIFNSVSSDLEAFIKASGRESVDKSLSIEKIKIGTQNITESFHLDDNGKYHYQTSVNGHGFTLSCNAWVEKPEGLYSITIASSAGGGGHWGNVSAGTKIQFELKTVRGGDTTITIDISSNLKNVDGEVCVDIDY